MTEQEYGEHFDAESVFLRYRRDSVVDNKDIPTAELVLGQRLMDLVPSF